MTWGGSGSSYRIATKSALALRFRHLETATNRHSNDPHRHHARRLRGHRRNPPARQRRLRSADQRQGRTADLVGVGRRQPSHGHARPGRKLQRRDPAASGIEAGLRPNGRCAARPEKAPRLGEQGARKGAGLESETRRAIPSVRL
jgi:hypothetical protein